MTRDAPGETKLVSVEVVESEKVEGRGAARTHWLVAKGKSWITVSEWPGAEIESLDGGPGIVWERLVRLKVPERTEFTRVEVRPRPETPRDPLAYLERDSSRTPRTTRRTVFLARRDGRLIPKK